MIRRIPFHPIHVYVYIITLTVCLFRDVRISDTIIFHLLISDACNTTRRRIYIYTRAKHCHIVLLYSFPRFNHVRSRSVRKAWKLYGKLKFQRRFVFVYKHTVTAYVLKFSDSINGLCEIQPNRFRVPVVDHGRKFVFNCHPLNAFALSYTYSRDLTRSFVVLSRGCCIIRRPQHSFENDRYTIQLLFALQFSMIYIFWSRDEHYYYYYYYLGWFKKTSNAQSRNTI